MRAPLSTATPTFTAGRRQRVGHHGGGFMQTPPSQSWPEVQQALQPQSDVPAPQTDTQVPRLHTCPQAQPEGHEAAAQTYMVMSVGSREHWRPTGQLPGHSPPHPLA